MKKILTLAFLACAAGSFANTPIVKDDNLCSVSFEQAKNTWTRDAAADRTYAYVEAKLAILQKTPSDKRKGEKYEAELKSCRLAVELLKAQLETAAISQQYVNAKKEISLVQDSIIALQDGYLTSLNVALDNERSINEENQLALAQKDSLLAAQKAEADKRLEALNSKAMSVYKDARGTILSMSDILFEFGKADLKPELKDNLTEVAAILKTLLAESNVEVEGHTDNVGSAASNKLLSQNRANAVLGHLVSRGVDKKRLTAVGYGLSKPIGDNKTEEGRAKNRRVELVIKDK